MNPMFQNPVSHNPNNEIGRVDIPSFVNLPICVYLERRRGGFSRRLCLDKTTRGTSQVSISHFDGSWRKSFFKADSEVHNREKINGNASCLYKMTLNGRIFRTGAMRGVFHVPVFQKYYFFWNF